jgi:hypothetical protein
MEITIPIVIMTIITVIEITKPSENRRYCDIIRYAIVFMPFVYNASSSQQRKAAHFR